MKALIVGSGPPALYAPSSGVRATVCLRSRPVAGGSPGRLSLVSVNSRSSHWFAVCPQPLHASAISLVRIWLIAFWLPLVGAAPWITTLSVIASSWARYAAVKPGNACSVLHCLAHATVCWHVSPGTPYSKIAVNGLRPHVAPPPAPHRGGCTTPKMKRSSPGVLGVPEGL